LEGPDAVPNSTNIQYKVIATYTGTGEITISDPLPTNATFVSATGTYTCTSSPCVSGTVSWKLKDNPTGPDVSQSDLAKNYTFTLVLHPSQDDILVKNKVFANLVGGSGLIVNPGIGNFEIMTTPDYPEWVNFQKAAIPIARSYGFPLSVMMGMAANETGFGQSDFAKNRNNWFGFMAYDDNPNAAATFSSPAESVQYFLDLITKNKLYAKAWSTYQQTHDPVQLLQGMKDAGYASDPVYVQKISGGSVFKFYNQQESGQQP
jgi:hypothetical protein